VAPCPEHPSVPAINSIEVMTGSIFIVRHTHKNQYADSIKQ